MAKAEREKSALYDVWCHIQYSIIVSARDIGHNCKVQRRLQQYLTVSCQACQAVRVSENDLNLERKPSSPQPRKTDPTVDYGIGRPLGRLCLFLAHSCRLRVQVGGWSASVCTVFPQCIGWYCVSFPLFFCLLPAAVFRRRYRTHTVRVCLDPSSIR